MNTRLLAPAPLAVAVAVAAAALLVCAPAAAHPAAADSATATGTKSIDRSDLATALARVRQATSRFRDINVAFAEGYIIPGPEECIDAAHEGEPRQLGAMGVHLVRPDLLSITAVSPRVNGTGTHTDFTQPAVLVYEPLGNGRYDLVAVENLVFAQAWHTAGNVERPEFHGYQYYQMVDNPLTPADEAHGFEPHYELHVWLYRDNPSGMFMQFNPRVSCAHAVGH